MGQARAWDVSLELCARCLAGAPAPASTDRHSLLVTRMLMQQRWPG